MSRWFRFYEDVVNDPKVQRLAGDTFKAWVNILCIASKNGGVLPPLADIAFALRLADDQASDVLNQLYRLQLLDEVELPDAPMSYKPHNWTGRQYKSDAIDPTAATRQKRYRKHKRNADRNGARNADSNATVSVTATRAETEQIQKEEYCPVGKPTRTKNSYPEDFEKFWLAYPRSPTMSKSEALKAWMKLDPDRRLQACQAIEPYRQYLRTKPNLETVHACRFLSQERFDGFVNGAGPIAASHAGSFV